MLSISGKFFRRRNKPTAFYYQDLCWRSKRKFWIGVKRTCLLSSYFVTFVSFFLFLLITTHSALSVFTKKSQFINNFSVTKGLNRTKVVTFPSLKIETNSTALVASTLRFLERDTNQTFPQNIWLSKYGNELSDDIFQLQVGEEEVKSIL